MFYQKIGPAISHSTVYNFLFLYFAETNLSEVSINTRVSDMRILHIDTPARLLERERRKRSGRPLVCADRSGTETMKDKSFPANYKTIKNYKPTLEKKRLFDYNVILK